MKRMKTNPNILTEPPSPTTSPTMLKHQSSRYWNENPEASSVDSLYLEEKTKAAIGELYNLIDTNGDGELTIEDFQKPTSAMSRDAIVKWELLCARPGPTALHTSVTCSFATARLHRRTEFDFDNNGIVDPNEFVNGLKRMALKAPLDATCFASVPSSHRECLLWLNASTNNTIHPPSLQGNLLQPWSVPDIRLGRSGAPGISLFSTLQIV